MLLLTEATLFYRNLSLTLQERPKPSGTIKNWASNVATAPTTKAKGTSSRTSSTAVASSTATSGKTSAATTKIQPPKRHVNVDLDSTDHVSWTMGGFDDDDEAEEREAALSSPIKGNTRVTSAVNIILSS